MPVPTARELIRMEYGNSKNFMTPHVIKVGKLAPNFAYELSQGEGIGGGTMYGISVVQYFPEGMGSTKRRTDLSMSKHSLLSAESYIEDLRIKVRLEGTPKED